MSTSPQRERFARALAHQPTDRPPSELGATDLTDVLGGLRRLAPALGLDPQAADAEEAVLRGLDIDMRGVGGVLAPPSPWTGTRANGDRVDCWGVVRRWTGVNWEIAEYPLRGATRAELEHYPFPDPERIDRAVIQRYADDARRLYEGSPYVVVARHPCYGVLEIACWMCGYDDFLERIAGDPEFVERFFERFLAYQTRVQEIYFGALGRYCHLTTSGDDFGTQAGPMLSPASFRRLVKPWIARRFQHLRRCTGAALFHHTCGGVRPLIPDLIDLGVDILNPIQPHAAGMEPEGLKRDFGDRLCFHGGIDTQHLLPRGTPEEVAVETRRIVGIMGVKGGYVLAPAHCIQDDVPAANVVAMFHATKGNS